MLYNYKWQNYSHLAEGYIIAYNLETKEELG